MFPIFVLSTVMSQPVAILGVLPPTSAEVRAVRVRYETRLLIKSQESIQADSALKLERARAEAIRATEDTIATTDILLQQQATKVVQDKELIQLLIQGRQQAVTQLASLKESQQRDRESQEAKRRRPPK